MTTETVTAPRAPAAPARRMRLRRVAGTVALVVGLLLAIDAGLTVAWQEPLTGVLGRLAQHRLGDQLRALEGAGPTPQERRTLARLDTEPARLAFLARSLARRTPQGAAVGRLRIPAIGTDFVVVKGSDPPDLRKGPGFYDGSPLPGVHGTIAIAGHRTTYLAPFRHLDRLAPGDRITIRMPYATFDYRVQRRRIVSPDALWILRRARKDRLVLSACHPLFSAAKRIVVFAGLERVTRARAA